MPLKPLTLQVRAAATMGGNLVLAKEKALESDVATLLSALQAQVGVTSVDKEDLRYHPSMHVSEHRTRLSDCRVLQLACSWRQAHIDAV